MAGSFSYFLVKILLCFIYFLSFFSVAVKAGRVVNVTVYYETHCPFCIRFFRSQLGPAVNGYAAHMNLHMVPYGNALTTDNRDGRYSFDCQHGFIECFGNKLHACAIDAIRNNTKAALFNTCLMTSSYDYGAIVKRLSLCGAYWNVSATSVNECATGARGAHLLKDYGRETEAARPNGVPCVTLDGRRHTGNLEKNLCGLLHPRPWKCFNKFGYYPYH